MLCDKIKQSRGARQCRGRGGAAILFREVRDGLANNKAHLSRILQEVWVKGHEDICGKILQADATTHGKVSGAGAFRAC